MVGVLLTIHAGCSAELDSIPESASPASVHPDSTRPQDRDNVLPHTPSTTTPAWEEVRMCDNTCTVAMPKSVRIEVDHATNDTYISGQKAYYATLKDSEAFFVSTQKLAPDIPGEPGFVDAVVRGFIKGRIGKHLNIDVDPENDELLARYARLAVKRLDTANWVADYSIGDDEIVLIGRINICGGWQVVMESGPPATKAEAHRFLNSFSMTYLTPN